jgi:ABC-2 type transport system permease protein
MIRPLFACFSAGARETWQGKSGIATMLLIYATLMVVFQSIFKVFPVHELGIPGLTWKNLLWYFAMTEMVIVAIQGNDRILARRIAEDGLTLSLSRPGSMTGLILAQSLGGVFVNILILTCAAAVLLPLLTGIAPPVKIAEAPFLMLSVFLGSMIFLLIGYAVSTVEVHGPYSRPLSWIVNKFIFTFGGLFFPVVFFPEWLQKFLSFTPFPSTIGTPATAMILPGSLMDTHGIMRQMFWVIAVGILTFACQRRLVAKVMRDGD